MKLQISHFIAESYVDGPGRRSVVFFQGCPIHCPGCQNERLWPFDGGQAMDVEEVAARLLDAGGAITISGGEPFAQPEGLLYLLSAIRLQDPDKNILVYSGFALEDLVEISEVIPEIMFILECTDVLVDGPYVTELDHDRLQWRGSSNQSPIDLDRSPGIFHGDKESDLWILSGWDRPLITITEGGDILGAAGNMRELFDATELIGSRMCGQTQEAERAT